MGNVFNFSRLFRILNKDMQENWKRYVLQFVTMFGVIAVVMTLLSDDKYSQANLSVGALDYIDRDLLMAASLLFMVFGVVFASTLMEPMNNKAKRISFLSVPASNQEKVFSRWLIVTVVYMAAFFVAFLLADAMRVAIFSFNYPDLGVHFVDLGKMIRPKDAPSGHGYLLQSNFFCFFLSLYFFVQSIFILGATFWEKASFVKTFSLGVILILLLVLVCRWAVLLSYDDFNQFGVVLSALDKLMDLTLEARVMFMTLFFSLAALSNWTLAFLRFKESEVIKKF